jgi:DNA-binding NtrC family response regulator
MAIPILVVGDQADIRDRVQELLEDEGYAVHTADGPAKAIQFLLRTSRPCLLLWDPIDVRQGLTMIDQATLQGVHVAALPVSVDAVDVTNVPVRINKRLTNEEAILAVVRKHCPQDPETPLMPH